MADLVPILTSFANTPAVSFNRWSGAQLPGRAGVTTPAGQPVQPNQQPQQTSATHIQQQAGTARQPDTVQLSPQAVAQGQDAQQDEAAATKQTEQAGQKATSQDTPGEPKAPNGDELTPEQKKQVEKLKARDAEVKTHEQAHVAAAGPLFRGGPNYSYQKGPDGKRYAVGGSVQIDTSEGRTPEETIAKAKIVQAAALAPAEPSSTDRRVAAKAASMERQAQQELREQQADKAAPDLEQPEAGSTEQAANTQYSSEATTQAAVTTAGSVEQQQARQQAGQADSQNASQAGSAAANATSAGASSIVEQVVKQNSNAIAKQNNSSGYNKSGGAAQPANASLKLDVYG